MDARSEHEFREFVDARSLALLRTAYVLTGDQHLAEDLVQNALAKLAARWHKVNEPEAYVRRAIYHDQVSRWRRRARIREDPSATPWAGNAGAVHDPAARDPAEQVGPRLDVLQALRKLAPRQRAVLVLRFLEDLPEREVAAVLGCSVGTVRSQTSRALARLRVLAPDLADHPLAAAAAAARKPTSMEVRP
ncbi:SigE family RNA polymerase sigma factor [Actinopolymorpha sp. B17G11]|uniref:SigE family RNA polymerase sigma factor n=1 Tax=unclassified Actinopolymorpha TaxID=2627063 RepID=UPI0032D8C9CD